MIVANHLKNLTMNFIIFFTKEANDEIKRILSSRAFYIGADNKLVYSVGTETLNYVIKSIHKLSEMAQ